MKNNQKVKIIHILCHSIPYREDYILDGWPARLAKQIQKYTGDYDQVCCFAITGIKKNLELKLNGISYKLFPAFTLSKTLESFFALIYCPELFKFLKSEFISGKVILQLQGERGSIVLQTIHTARPNPIFIQFHGYSVPKWLSWFEKMFLVRLEKYFFKSVHHFFVSIKNRVDYLTKDCRIPKNRISFTNLGVKYDLFKPAPKKLVRQKLGIPQDKTVFLHVGRFDRVKGLREIIRTNNKLKKKYNTFLILIGGPITDEFYAYAGRNADLVIERTEHDKLVQYFNASDAYCMLCPPEKALTGGMGIAPTEALACNKPILSSNLREAPETIRNKIGFLVESEKDLREKMKIIINKQYKFGNIRALTEPYFSWPKIIENILDKYSKSL